MMDDTISRQSALDIVDELNSPDWYMEWGAEARRRLVDLPPAQPKITLASAIDYLHSIGWMQGHDRIMIETLPRWNRLMMYLADLQLTYSPGWGSNGQGDQKLYDFVTGLIEELEGWEDKEHDEGKGTGGN